MGWVAEILQAWEWSPGAGWPLSLRTVSCRVEGRQMLLLPGEAILFPEFRQNSRLASVVYNPVAVGKGR